MLNSLRNVCYFLWSHTHTPHASECSAGETQVQPVFMLHNQQCLHFRILSLRKMSALLYVTSVHFFLQLLSILWLQLVTEREGILLVTEGLSVQFRRWVMGCGVPEQGTQSLLLLGCSCTWCVCVCVCKGWVNTEVKVTVTNECV